MNVRDVRQCQNWAALLFSPLLVASKRDEPVLVAAMLHSRTVGRALRGRGAI